MANSKYNSSKTVRNSSSKEIVAIEKLIKQGFTKHQAQNIALSKGKLPNPKKSK